VNIGISQPGALFLVHRALPPTLYSTLYEQQTDNRAHTCTRGDRRRDDCRDDRRDSRPVYTLQAIVAATITYFIEPPIGDRRGDYRL